MKSWRFRWLCWCLCWFSGSALAQVGVLVVSSENSTPYLETTLSLVGALENGGVERRDVQVMPLEEWKKLDPLAQSGGARVTVALGSGAAAALANVSIKAPVLNALLPRASFERVVHAAGRKSSAHFNALFLDQPLPRQLALMRLALPKAQRLGVLWGPDSWLRAATLQRLTRLQGWTLQEARVTNSRDLPASLLSVLDACDVLLALADPLVYNSNSLQNILMTSIRADVPMVAFSPAYVRAGALLAIYSTPQQVGAQAAKWVLDALAQRPLPAQALEPDDFEIAVNEPVARNLNLKINVTELRQALLAQERRP